tara:strand:- start:1422 stop:1688 length:267 start_codon:yes stop_codon:yes gene_type:complete
MCYKKALIEIRVEELIERSNKAMRENLTKILNSSSIDIEGYDTENNIMILPKTIMTAILEEESLQYICKTTKFYPKMKKEIKNIRSFI